MNNFFWSTAEISELISISSQFAIGRIAASAVDYNQIDAPPIERSLKSRNAWHNHRSAMIDGDNYLSRIFPMCAIRMLPSRRICSLRRRRIFICDFVGAMQRLLFHVSSPDASVHRGRVLASKEGASGARQKMFKYDWR